MISIPKSYRLSYKLMSEADKQLLFELDQNPNVMKHINGGIPTSWEQIEERFIPRLNAYRNPEKGWGLWQVNITYTGEFIGWVLVRPMDFFGEQMDESNLEVGWRFKEEYWGQGFASEAADAVITGLAHQPDIKAFSALAVPGNIGSIRVMEKIGMEYIKTYIHEDSGVKEEVVYYRKANNC